MARAGSGNPFGMLYMLVALLTTGCAVAILVIVNQDLWYTSWVSTNTVIYQIYNRCFMQTDSSQDSINLCYFSWAGAGVGLFFSLWLFFMQLCSRRGRRIPAIEVGICVLATLWWIACATTATVYGTQADDSTPSNTNSSSAAYQDWYILQDKKGYRTAVWALGWTNVGLWLLASLVSLKDCASARKAPPPQPAYPTGAYVAAQPGPYQQPYYAQPAPGYAAAPGYPPAGAPYQPSPFSTGAAAPPPGYPPASNV